MNEAMGLSLSLSVENGTGILAVEGEITVEVSQRLRQAAEDALSRDGISRFVIDLGKVPYIDSSGLGALIASGKVARLKAIDLALMGVSPTVRRFFAVTGLHQAFRFIHRIEDLK